MRPRFRIQGLKNFSTATFFLLLEKHTENFYLLSLGFSSLWPHPSEERPSSPVIKTIATAS